MIVIEIKNIPARTSDGVLEATRKNILTDLEPMHHENPPAHIIFHKNPVVSDSESPLLVFIHYTHDEERVIPTINEICLPLLLEMASKTTAPSIYIYTKLLEFKFVSIHFSQDLG